VIVLVSEVNASTNLSSLVTALSKHYRVELISLLQKEPLFFRSLNGSNILLRVLLSPGAYATKYLSSIAFLFHRLRNDPDSLVLVSGFKAQSIGIPLALLARMRHRVYIRHHADIHHRWGRFHWYLLDILISRISTKIVAVSELVATILQQREFVSAKRISVIWNGIDLEEFARIRNVRLGKLNLSNNLVVVARHTKDKGIEIALEAFSIIIREFPLLKIKIYGSRGDATPFIHKRAKSLPADSVSFIEKYCAHDQIYSDAQILLHLPVATRAESFGLVYLEGLAAGLQCFYTETGILTTMKHRFGSHYWAIKMKDEYSLVDSLRTYLHDGTGKPEIDLSDLQDFSLENISNKYVDLISELTV